MSEYTPDTYIVREVRPGGALVDLNRVRDLATAISLATSAHAITGYRMAVVSAEYARLAVHFDTNDITEEAPMIGENAQAAADFAQPICECGMLADECACTDDPAPELNPAFAGLDFLEVDITTAPAWNAQLAAHAAAIVTSAALALTCLLPLHASAHELPLVPTDGECVITHEFEDGSATALCGHDTWAYDADGSFFYLDGIKFWIYPEGTWREIK
jgi:hypothetical protein